MYICLLPDHTLIYNSVAYIYIITSGSISVNSRHTGFPSTFAHKSHKALHIAATAKCVTPFSGPIYAHTKKPILILKKKALLLLTHLNWDSLVNSRQKAPNLANISAALRPTTKCCIARTANNTMSVPRPNVNVSPYPLVPHCV